MVNHNFYWMNNYNTNQNVQRTQSFNPNLNQNQQFQGNQQLNQTQSFVNQNYNQQNYNQQNFYNQSQQNNQQFNPQFQNNQFQQNFQQQNFNQGQQNYNQQFQQNFSQQNQNFQQNYPQQNFYNQQVQHQSFYQNQNFQQQGFNPQYSNQSMYQNQNQFQNYGSQQIQSFYQPQNFQNSQQNFQNIQQNVNLQNNNSVNQQQDFGSSFFDFIGQNQAHEESEVGENFNPFELPPSSLLINEFLDFYSHTEKQAHDIENLEDKYKDKDLNRSGSQIKMEIDHMNRQEYYPDPIEYSKDLDVKDEDILWEDSMKFIKLSTLDGLILQLTSPDYYEPHFTYSFLVTFRSFTEKNTVFEKLYQRFNIPPPSNISNEQFYNWKKSILDKTRLRIVSLLKYWIDTYFKIDFDQDFTIKIELFISKISKIKEGDTYAQVLQSSLDKAKKMEKITFQTNGKTPPIEKPKQNLTNQLFGTKFKNKILHWPSLEIARQLTLLDFEIFQKIEAKECFGLAWSKPGKEQNSPHIHELIARFNKLSHWIGTVIVQTTDLKTRAETIEKFIEIGEKLLELNNFNGLFSLCSGLGLASVYRLKKTWEKVSKESTTSYQKLQNQISTKGNFSNIREKVKKSTPPCIPYIGIYLTDLTFIEDGNKKMIEDKINYFKFRCFSNVLKDMQTYQHIGYALEVAKDLNDMLKNDMMVLPEKDMFNASLTIEPKEKK